MKIENSVCIKIHKYRILESSFCRCKSWATGTFVRMDDSSWASLSGDVPSP